MEACRQNGDIEEQAASHSRSRDRNLFWKLARAGPPPICGEDLALRPQRVEEIECGRRTRSGGRDSMELRGKVLAEVRRQRSRTDKKQ